MTIIRSFLADDAEGVSELFREVYGDRYVYSDLYVPTMIALNNAKCHWHSAVAVKNSHIVGHAALWMNDNASCAELAMFATHPSVRHRGLATKLGRYLCNEAHKKHLTTLTIKMVCSHPYSQQLAKKLGFHTTALLRDYVVSPFEPEARESVILGVQALQSRPVPQIVEMKGQHRWLSFLSTTFGHTQPVSCEDTASPLDITDIGERIEVTLHRLTNGVIEEISRLPHSRLIYLSVRINSMLPGALSALYRAGYRDMGLIPDNKKGWFWLFQRGFRQQNLRLFCPVAGEFETSSFSAR